MSIGSTLLASVDTREEREATAFAAHLKKVASQTDGLFAIVSGVHVVVALLIAASVHPTLLTAGGAGNHPFATVLCISLVLVGPVWFLARTRPGELVTHRVIGVQMALWSVLFIHLTGGSTESFYHVGVMFALMGMYRDWRTIILATAVLVGNDVVSGIVSEGPFPWLRLVEHAGWLTVYDATLVLLVVRALQEARMLAARQVAMEQLHGEIESKIEERTCQLEASREQYRILVENTHTIPWELDTENFGFTYMGPQAASLIGCPAEYLLAPNFFESRIHKDDVKSVVTAFFVSVSEKRYIEAEYRLQKADGTYVWMRTCIDGHASSDNRLRGFHFDISERRALELELQQAQKLESVGRLASGIAHEINTPIQFVSDSVHFLRGGLDDLLVLVGKYKAMRAAAKTNTLTSKIVAEVVKAESEADLEYLEENMPSAFARATEGLQRVAGLVRSMKEFAHPDQREKQNADLNHAIETTLIIAKNEYKYVADVETDLGPLPPVVCHVNLLNQVFLNLVVNAAHAIGDTVKGTEKKGTIKISTRLHEGHAIISVRDSGGGIPEAIRPKIFDPFFTTKEVGKGTGQGLAIARNVVVEKHGGSLDFETELGKGTTFFIKLPLLVTDAPAVAA